MGTNKLKLNILVDGKPVYFGEPVFYSVKTITGEETLVLQTTIGTTTKQKFELQIKNPVYVESLEKTTANPKE